MNSKNPNKLICRICHRPLYNGETIVHLDDIDIHSECFREVDGDLL